MGDQVTVTLTDPDRIENLEDGIAAVEMHVDADVSRSRGRPAADEITMSEAVSRMAAAYAGTDHGEDDE